MIFFLLIFLYLPVTKNTNPVANKDEKVDVEETKTSCTLPTKDSSQTNSKGACFWVEGWRSALCSCENCKKVSLSPWSL